MKISHLNLTYIFLVACLMGAQIISIDIGAFKLSPFRLLILTAPLIIPSLFTATFFRNKVIGRYGYISFMLLWMCYSLLSSVWVADHGAWAKAMIFLIGGFISTSLVFSFINNKRELCGALIVIVSFSCIYGILAFYEMATGQYHFVSEYNQDFYQNSSVLSSILGIRVPITVFGNPNDYGVFLFFSVIACFVLYGLNEDSLKRRIYLALMATLLFLTFATQSRAAIIGVVAFFGAYALIAFYRKKVRYKIKFIGIFALLFFLIFNYFDDGISAVASLLSIDLSDGGYGSDVVRRNLILNGLHFLYEYKLLGVGVGNIEHHMFVSPLYYTGHIYNIHNWWFEILVSSGVLVFLVYVLVYLRAAYRSILNSGAASSWQLRLINTCALCFYLSFLIAAVGSSSLFYNESIWPLMAIMMKVPFIKES